MRVEDIVVVLEVLWSERFRDQLVDNIADVDGC
jgi:hypothetical protein